MKDFENDNNETSNEMFTKRFKANDKFFASFIDLIPAQVYFTPDDRLSWMRALKAGGNNEAAKIVKEKVAQIVTQFTKPQSLSSIESKRKPILNKNGQIVYSKFDFTADKCLKTASTGSKKPLEQQDVTKLATGNVKPKDYKTLLKKLKQKKEKLDELKKTEPEKATELEMKNKWRTAIDKAAGVKVKDDPTLLAKAVKRIKKKKEKSKKAWDERLKSVEERKQRTQEKRKKNLEKRKEKNKEKKMKKLNKKGRILMGF